MTHNVLKYNALFISLENPEDKIQRICWHICKTTQADPKAKAKEPFFSSRTSAKLKFNMYF